MSNSANFRNYIRCLVILLIFSGYDLYSHPVDSFVGSSSGMPNLVPSISGPDSVCNGTGGHIYVTESGMTNYIWTLSSGGSITSGSGTNSVVVSWSQAGLGMVTVNYSTATSPGALDVMVLSGVVPSISVLAGANPACQGSPVTFIATPVNGGASPVFQWTVNGFPVGTNSAMFTYSPANGDAILCKLYSSLLCRSVYPAISNTISMIVNPNVPVSVSIATSANPVCVSSPVTLTAYPFNGGLSPVFEWKVNGNVAGTNSSGFTFIPNQGDLVLCSMTSSAVCAPLTPVTSNSITMSVSPMLPVSVFIQPSANPVCQNVQVVYTASPLHAGTSPSFQWKVNGINSGTNNPVFTHIPQDGDLISCILTSNAACATDNPATSNTISMIVIPSLGMPVSVAIAASANPSCFGVPATFTASAVNGGSAPVYNWTVNGLNVGANSPNFTYIPSTGDFIQCSVTSDLACATNNPAVSNQIAMTVNVILPVSVSIISSANPSCLGSTVTYTANAVNPGLSPVYQWKVNGVNTGTNQNSLVCSPVNGTVVTCLLTSGIGCTSGNPATSNAITMSVLPVLPVGISISTLTNPSCAGSQVTFNATITNGGASPVYQWKLNGNSTGSNSAVLIFTPASGDVITCKLTSNALCYTGNKVVTSTPINMLVSPELAPAVSIISSLNPFCEGNQVNYTATPFNGGTAPVYQWRVNCTPAGSGSAAFSYTPSDGDFVTCQMTS
ncbi:MAG: hypothetical protein WCP32_06345, partial [Bacteroidota bacterium]